MPKNSIRLRSRPASGGFTLPEILIALAIISLITVVTLGAIGPWLDFRQSLETERKLNEVKEGLATYYRNNAYAIESTAAVSFGPFVTSTVNAAGACSSQGAAFSSLGFSLSDSGNKAANDGGGNPFCVFISPQIAWPIDGINLYYRTIAIVSVGSNGKVDSGTRLNPATNALELGGDDKGITVSGLASQQEKYATTVKKLERIVDMYETYFTSRFLQTSDRDVSRYYFSQQGDASGSVAATGSNWMGVATGLSSIGVSPDLAVTAWEDPGNAGTNSILFNNQSGAPLGAVPSPRTPSTGAALPYSAVVAARIPGPGGPQYIGRVAIGNY